MLVGQAELVRLNPRKKDEFAAFIERKWIGEVLRRAMTSNLPGPAGTGVEMGVERVVVMVTQVSSVHVVVAP